jgi:hypothetical protein
MRPRQQRLGIYAIAGVLACNLTSTIACILANNGQAFMPLQASSPAI